MSNEEEERLGVVSYETPEKLSEKTDLASNIKKMKVYNSLLGATTVINFICLAIGVAELVNPDLFSSLIGVLAPYGSIGGTIAAIALVSKVNKIEKETLDTYSPNTSEIGNQSQNVEADKGYEGPVRR